MSVVFAWLVLYEQNTLFHNSCNLFGGIYPIINLKILDLISLLLTASFEITISKGRCLAFQLFPYFCYHINLPTWLSTASAYVR